MLELGFSGSFLIPWSQTELDGFNAVTPRNLEVGMVWSWHGEPVRVDGPSNVLRLEGSRSEENSRRRAVQKVRRLVGAALTDIGVTPTPDIEPPQTEQGFVVTDGAKSYTVTFIDVVGCSEPLLLFVGEIPPRETEMWVVHHSLRHSRSSVDAPDTGGVICFTPGTRIETPGGPRLVEELREGDWVQTRDNGAQEIQWMGSRRMTGARLFAIPTLRPIRIRAGALGVKRPDEELLVSPEHRMLIKGEVAQALFNTPEVLVAAKDLLNDSTVVVDRAVREVTYYHLLLPRHEVLWANGLETESFHPASTSLSSLDDADRRRLLDINPALEMEPSVYGGFARRSLSASEAAILRHEAA